MTREMTGAEMVIQALIDQGVEHIFGYPGGAVLPIYDELFQQEKVEHILVRHEQGAGHAAEGYARSTGKPGVALVTSGPAATNMVTPLTDALMDSIPLVCITGQVPTSLIGSDAFQECDTVGNHPALHQVQLAGSRRERPRPHPARGLRRRNDGPAGSGGRRHPEGRPVRHRHLSAAEKAHQRRHRQLLCGLSAATEGRSGGDPRGRST